MIARLVSVIIPPTCSIQPSWDSTRRRVGVGDDFDGGAGGRAGSASGAGGCAGRLGTRWIVVTSRSPLLPGRRSSTRKPGAHPPNGDKASLGFGSCPPDGGGGPPHQGSP